MDIREVVFNNRSYTPIPLILALLILAHPAPTSFVLGLLIAIAGELMRLWGVSHAGSATRTTSGAGGDELITSGPFAYVRNPLYLGNFLISLGFTIAAWAWMPWMLILVVLLFVVQYGLIISLEEDYLQRKFGPVYERYKNHVPRFIPRWRPWADAATRAANWQAAFRSEKSTLVSFVGIALLLWVRWKLFA